MSTPVHIRQIYYKPEQKEQIVAPGIPYNNCEDQSKQYEYGVFSREYMAKSGAFSSPKFKRNELYIGFLSWAFPRKAQLNVKDFVDFIDENPGYDAYGLQPYRFVEAFNNYKINFWQQGNRHHPHILSVAQKIFDDLGYGIDLIKERVNSENLLCCNYWVGNKSFWDDYISFCEPIKKIMTSSKGKMFDMFFNEYPKGYFPYIMERLWTTFVINKQKKVKIKIQ